MRSLHIRHDPLLVYPYLVQTAKGLTLACFKTRPQAHAYCKSRLVALALDLGLHEFSDRREASEEETLP